MTQRSGLALAVLSLVVENPMHPYRMAQLIRERGKSDVVNVGQRSQLYKTIDRLVRDGLIVEHGTERDAARPERTVYTATAEGREVAVDWMVGMLAAPRHEFGEFTAALAHLAMIDPPTALAAFEARLVDRTAELDRRRARLATAPPALPRVVLVDDDYVDTLLEAEVAWLRRLVDDLRSGALTWDTDELRAASRRFDSPDDS